MKRLTVVYLCLTIASFILGSTFSAATQTDIVGLTVDSSGNVGIGTTKPTAGLEISKGNTNDTALKLTSSGAGWGSGMRFVNTAGGVEYGIYAGADGSWHFTDQNVQTSRLLIKPNGDTIVTGGLFIGIVPNRDKGNAQWDKVTNQICYDNSSRRDKQNIRSLEEDFNKLLDAAPKTYTRRGFPETWEIGYIAEDFERLGLTKLLYYDEDGRPDAINYTKMGLYLVEIVKNHDKQMKYYEQKTGNLEAEIRQLRAMLEKLATRHERK